VRIKLRKELYEYELSSHHEFSFNDSSIYFPNKSSAQSFLYRFMDNPFNITLMRRMLIEGGLNTDISRLMDHDVIEQLALQLLTGMTTVVAKPVTPIHIPTWDDGQASAEPKEESYYAPMAAPSRDEKHWIQIELVGEDGVGIKNEKYMIITEDGNSYSGSTNAKGIARLEDISQGICRLTFTDLDEEAWENI